MTRPFDADERATNRAKLMGLGDISGRKSYYPELQSRLAELERFRALLDQSSDTILLVDGKTGHVVDVSGAADTLGAPRERLVGRLVDALLTPKGASRLRRVLVKGRGLVFLDSETSRMVIDGRAAPPLEANVRVVTFGDRKYAIVACRDVTAQVEARREVEKARAELERRVQERTKELTTANVLLQEAVREHKDAEERFRAARDLAEEASRAKTEFLSVVSHELRTPLTAVRGFAQIIVKQLGRHLAPLSAKNDAATRSLGQILENLDIIILESHRLSGLIDDLLDFSKLESGRADFICEPVDLGNVLTRAVQATESLFHEADVPLDVFAPSDLPRVAGDADRLMQVVVNLLSNAVKFTGMGGRVTCEAWAGREHVLISVSDTGEGIPEEYLERIFDKFVQAGDPLTGRPKGTGLGLAISRQIVERHGGHIWAESKAGQGSTFYFNIPTISDQNSLKCDHGREP